MTYITAKLTSYDDGTKSFLGTYLLELLTYFSYIMGKDRFITYGYMIHCYSQVYFKGGQRL